jgi:hypothetical protein
MTPAVQRLANRIGQLAWRHEVIMRQTWLRRESCVVAGFCAWLIAAED